MKQILQNLKDGRTEVADVPVPQLKPGCLMIRTTASLISAGTERMLVEFGKANLLDKARQQPDKVRMVLEKVRTDGLVNTIEAVRSKLDQPLALGYCNVGVILAVGAGVEGFAVGDRVASNGKHAEVVCVPKNLCARVPADVDDEAAAFTVVGAVGLQSIRLAQPTLGECVVVTGLGLIGLMTVQMLCAQGCRVLGVDFDPARLDLARQFGAEASVNPGEGEDVLAAARSFSRGRGVDAVIISASTDSNEPVSQAAKMCRKRGRIVLVGVTGLELSRADFFEKELSFQVSCSYGPGRYDTSYEERGHDYPVGFVRWTEQRNFEAVLDMMASGRLEVAPLATHRFELSQAAQAYGLLSSKVPFLGILLKYPDTARPEQELGAATVAARPVALGSRKRLPGSATVAFLGAGNYAGRLLIPAFQAAGAYLQTVVSSGGVSAVHFGRKFGFAEAGTDVSAALEDDAVDTVVIATRHDAHAGQVLAALAAGRHVFCEKPLCLTLSELDEIEQAMAARPEQLLMAGFNRRFSPQVMEIKSLVGTVAEPKSFIMTVNAGKIPADHWTQDPAVGGGRIIGEACHFIDLLRHLAGAPITGHSVFALGRGGGSVGPADNVSIMLEFADGSVGTIHYLANGHKSFPKERLEVFAGGRILQLDNFRRLRGWGWKQIHNKRLWRQDKGQTACAAAFVGAVREGGPSPIAADEILEVSRVSIEVAMAVGG